jgi:hypothetical protein
MDNQRLDELFSVAKITGEQISRGNRIGYHPNILKLQIG